MRSLSMLLCHAVEQEAHTAYFASALWSVIQYASMGKSTFPTWSEAFPPHREDDNATEQDIKNNILQRLEG